MTGAQHDGGQPAVPTLSLELMLAGWRESNAGGATVTFWLPGSADLDAFRAMTVRKGGKAGQRFMAALALLGDDDVPVEPPQAAVGQHQATPAAHELKGGPLSRLAGRWCCSEAFQQWIRPVYDRHLGGDGSGWGDIGRVEMEPADFARHAILVLCDIDSRRELDHDAAAASRFHELVRAEFGKHLARLGDAAVAPRRLPP